jgi:hypothetical protein
MPGLEGNYATCQSGVGNAHMHIQVRQAGCRMPDAGFQNGLMRDHTLSDSDLDVGDFASRRNDSYIGGDG